MKLINLKSEVIQCLDKKSKNCLISTQFILDDKEFSKDKNK